MLQGVALCLPARGRPQAAARRAGLEFVEKLLTANLTSTILSEGTVRGAGAGAVAAR